VLEALLDGLGDAMAQSGRFKAVAVNHDGRLIVISGGVYCYWRTSQTSGRERFVVYSHEFDSSTCVGQFYIEDPDCVENLIACAAKHAIPPDSLEPARGIIGKSFSKILWG
jgi:hypothetical protein